MLILLKRANFVCRYIIFKYNQLLFGHADRAAVNTIILRKLYFIFCWQRVLIELVDEDALSTFCVKISKLRLEILSLFGFSESEVWKVQVLFTSVPDVLLLLLQVWTVQHGYSKDFHFLKLLRSQNSHVYPRTCIHNLLILVLHLTKVEQKDICRL